MAKAKAAINDAVDWVGDTVRKAADSTADTVRAIIKNPLPVIETIALTMMGVPPPVANAVVTAMNGGNIEDIAKSAAVSYVGGKVANAASDATTSALQPSQGAYLPTAAESTMIKVASSAVGADAAATVSALASGKSLEDSLKAGTAAATTSVITSAGTIAGKEVAGQIQDPTLSKVAGAATKAGTIAALSGKDAGSAVLSAAGEAAKQPLLDAAGNAISSAAGNVDLSGVKSAIQPISDVATKVAQAGSDVATKVLQPLEAPIKGAVQSTSDALTAATKPVGDALASAGDSVKSTMTDVTKNIPQDTLDKSIINLMGQAPGAGTSAAQPAVSQVATGSEGSPAAFAGSDVAMLGDTSEAGLGSKVSKKGGKYPWGEPEGTTALKEGLGIG